MGNFEWAVEQLKRLHSSGFDVDFDELRGVLDDADVWWTLLSDTLRIGLVIGDLQGNLIAVSPGVTELLGYDEDEMRRLGMVGVTHPDDMDKDLELFLALVRGERPRYQIDKRYVRKDGSAMWGSLTVMVLSDSGGIPCFAVAMIEDVSERRTTQDLERQVHDHGERRRQALEMNDVVLQNLVVAKWALDRGDSVLTKHSLDETFTAARALIDRLLETEAGRVEIGPGDLVRAEAATVEHPSQP